MMKTDKLFLRKWGVFNHYLSYMQNAIGTPNNPENKRTSFSDMVNEFDVDGLARSLHEIGAGYYFITVQQGAAELLAPNAAFDSIAGTIPGQACAKRDLILDLYEALSKYDIDLYLYFTGDGPYQNVEIGKKFGFVEPRENGVTEEFVRNWAKVLEEYALRYGDRVKGWWIDGCYRDFFKYTDDLVLVYKDVILKGNPNAIVAFNNGVKPELIRQFRDEDFTAGEFDHLNYLPNSRFADGSQIHILASLAMERESEQGSKWGSNGVNMKASELSTYINRVNAVGGVVTLDCGITRRGEIFPEQLDVLRELTVPKI